MIYVIFLFLSKYLESRNNAEHIAVEILPSVSVKESILVFVGFKIVPKRPSAPEKVDVPVADTAVSDVDKSGKAPIVKHNVRQAVVAVDEGIVFQRRAVFFDDLHRFLCRCVAEGIGEGFLVIISRAVVFKGESGIGLDPVLHGAVGKIATMQIVKKLGIKLAKPLRVNGMSVQIEVISRVIKNTLFIPVEAVFERQSSFYVYRRVGGTPKETAVSIGESNDNFVQITDGLEEGDVVYLYRPYDKKQSE